MANNLFVSYDLIAPGKHYPRVTKAIEAIGGYLKIHFSLYYLHTNLTASQVFDHVIKAMDANDKLLVIEATNAISRANDPHLKVMTQHWNK